MQLAEALLNPKCYPHPVTRVKLIETHLSWVFLTGEHVYKLKKPVCFDFVDFSTLSLREHFCREELRCNAVFAPELYIGVDTVVQRGEDLLIVTDPAPTDVVVEYAVHMHQFDDALQADRLLARDELSTDEMFDFGARLGAQHLELPELDRPYKPADAILENFDTLANVSALQGFDESLALLKQQALDDLKRFESLLMLRLKNHFVRECHGDLHLSNLARLSSGITAFDCLEFDESLRHIDVWGDTGFLFMDCCIRQREDLAYAFIDGYLGATADYDGLVLLPMFAAYRSVVRAKIAALRFAQAHEEAAKIKVAEHLQWPLDQQAREVGTLFITCGLSGSGKSYWAKRLLPHLPGLRLRSDVWRKAQHGLAQLEDSGSDLGAGLYSQDKSFALYEALGQHAVNLAVQGEHVIVDAASLQQAQREILYTLASSVSAPVKLLYFTATDEILRARISERNARAIDPSEADEAVLDWQYEHFDVPTGAEAAIELDTQTLSLEMLLARVRA